MSKKHSVKNDPSVADVTVLGAGIVGITSALELQRRGYTTLLVDRDDPGNGCSFGNGGAIGPNTCTPFALPGILRKIPGWYLDPDGPITVNPGWALRSAPWVLRWINSSRQDAARRSARGMRFLHDGCLDAYRDMLGAALYADLMREEGYLYVYESAAQSRSELFAEALRRELGIPSRMLDADELRELEPSLSGEFRRATLLPGNGHTINPKRLVDTLFGKLQAAGGAFIRAEATSLEVIN
ncbi:MAG: FAD-dependent oxidoreductase, partial [Rhizobiaceae bacterium]|nr:FAD-dependent oxidoreductase [Rhizobiaceae bacterium]